MSNLHNLDFILCIWDYSGRSVVLQKKMIIQKTCFEIVHAFPNNYIKSKIETVFALL